MLARLEIRPVNLDLEAGEFFLEAAPDLCSSAGGEGKLCEPMAKMVSPKGCVLEVVLV